MTRTPGSGLGSRLRWLLLALLLVGPGCGCGGTLPLSTDTESPGGGGGGGGGGDDCTDPEIDFDLRTQTQGGWGAPCNGNNPGCYRDANFAGAFPLGLTIGCAAGFEATFTTAAAIEAFLPAGGPPGVLTADVTDPLSTAAGVLAGQLVAATLNVGFDAFDPAFGSDVTLLADLEFVDPASPCFGMTVQEVVDLGHDILGGCSTQLTPSQINACLTTINENFDNGSGTNLGDLGQCPPAEPASMLRAGPPGVQPPSSAEQQFAAEVLGEVQTFRLLEGAGLLIFDAATSAVARAHALDMAAKGFVGHVNTLGEGPGDRLAAAGLSWTAFGELISSALTDAHAVISFWRRPETDEAVLRALQVTHVGIGVVINGADAPLVVLLMRHP